MAEPARQKCEMEDACLWDTTYVVVYRALVERRACLFHCEYIVAFNPQRIKEIRDLQGHMIPVGDIPNTHGFR